MDAVIIAAGEGTRMRPLTERRPKPLLPIGRDTLVERTMRQCADVVDRFVLVVGYRAADVEAAIGDRYAGLPVEYVEQRDALGTAHAVGQVAGTVDGRFLVLNGDVVVDGSLPRRLVEATGTAMAVRSVPDPTGYGVVDVENGRVTGLVEKPAEPPSNLINTGVYAFEQSIFEYVGRVEQSQRGEYELTDAIALAIDNGVPVSAVEYGETWLDVGRPWELLAANETALSDLDARINGVVEDGVRIEGRVVVEEGARIRSGSYVEGPVVIRSGADVGPNAYLRGATVIGSNARVGNAVEVKNSVLMAGATVGHLSYVGDSVLGRGVNFGAGTTVANLRHDDRAVEMTVKGERVDTGRRKLGVVVGDGAKTGINTSINAGVKLGTDARTIPGETVFEDRT